MIAPRGRRGPIAAAMPATALAGCAHLVALHDPLTASENNDRATLADTEVTDASTR